MFEAFS
jgi:glutaminase